MSFTESYLAEDPHPIDIVETLAEHHHWDFDRVGEDQISMVVEGQWRSYSITLAWSHQDECLRLISSFEMEPPHDRMGELYEVLNHVNDMIWAGSFTWWSTQQLMVYRYGLVLTGGQVASIEQINAMIDAAVLTAERFYPAFQLVAWADHTPEAAVKTAIAEAWGRA